MFLVAPVSTSQTILYCPINPITYSPHGRNFKSRITVTFSLCLKLPATLSLNFGPSSFRHLSGPLRIPYSRFPKVDWNLVLLWVLGILFSCVPCLHSSSTPIYPYYGYPVLLGFCWGGAALAVLQIGLIGLWWFLMLLVVAVDSLSDVSAHHLVFAIAFFWFP